jgi:AcrR family transcriptional regulator
VPRLTRAESQARTREKLLETARELFLRDGYLPTSLDRVAEAAGFSKGAVYSNFRNKDELCMAVLDDIRAERAMEIAELLRAPSPEERLLAFERWAKRVVGDPQWTMLELEFGVHAGRDPGLRSQLADRISMLGDTAGAAITAAGAGNDLSPALPPKELGIALLALGVGLGLFRSIDPGISVDALVDTVRVLAGVPAGAAGQSAPDTGASGS